MTRHRFLHFHDGGRLGRRLLTWVLLWSFFFTMVGTAIQLAVDYRKDLEILDWQLEQIQRSRVPSLTTSLWHLDQNQLVAQLDGILELRDITFVRVVTPDGMTFFRGQETPKRDLEIREFPLVYTNMDRQDHIGILTVAADKRVVHGRIWDKFLVILATQGVQFYLLAVFITFSVFMLVTRHLQRMSRYASELTIDRLQTPLVLEKSQNPAHPDEIDMVVTAFNTMRENLLKDISQRVHAEAKLVFAEGYLRSIIDSMPSTLIAVDMNGRITQWNQQAALTTGLGAEEALGMDLEKAFPQLPVSMCQIAEAVRSEKPVTIPKILDARGEMARFMDVTIYPLVSPDIQGAVVRMDDVSDRVRMEEMVIQSEKMLSVGGLAAGMAHEINNPLAGILQNLQVMRNRFAPGLPVNVTTAGELGLSMEQLNSYLERRGCLRMMDAIMDSGKRAARIVENMLSFSRKSSVQVAVVDICGLLDRTLELAANEYDLKKKYDFREIEIIREYEPNLPFVPCEESKIQQVFFNLIRNGAQAMGGQGRDHPRFVFRVFQKAGTVTIEVEDNGPGISEELRTRVFEPFFTTKRVGEGTGLGLSVSYFIIVENHGGAMDVESSPGGGTKFVVSLPLARKSQIAEENSAITKEAGT